MKNLKELQSLIGNYQFKSPYHNKHVMLPFNIVSVDEENTEFPFHVNTVEYKGWTKKAHFGNYNYTTIKDFIDTGFIVPKQ